MCPYAEHYRVDGGTRQVPRVPGAEAPSSETLGKRPQPFATCMPRCDKLGLFFQSLPHNAQPSLSLTCNQEDTCAQRLGFLGVKLPWEEV